MIILILPTQEFELHVPLLFFVKVICIHPSFSFS